MDDQKNTINMSTLLNEWHLAKQNRENHTNDFPTLDNIVDAVPINHQGDAPYVGDTTLPELVRSIPKASLQQLPVFSATVNGTKNSVEAQIASYLLRRGVFNQDTFGKGLLSTLQIGAEQAITHGYAPFITATGTMFNEFGTTMRLLHYTDVDPEPGIQDANEASYFYVSANLTKSRVQKIYNAAKENPDTLWDVELLEQLLETEPDGENYSLYASDPRNKAGHNSVASTYKFVTRYEVGGGGNFVTFCDQIESGPLRVVPNRSKFGYPRVQFLVIDPAPLTPFGISRVRLASPNQNLMNVYYQNIASMLLLNSKPPIFKQGRFTKPVQLKQGAVWEGMDQNSRAELMSMDNGALSQFVPMSEHMSSQIQKIMGKPTAASTGDSYSKTAPGVRLQEKDLTIEANQITNILENFLRQYALVALDVYISEQTGEDELVVDDEAKNAINRISPDAIGDDNRITINWEEFYEAIEDWTVEIDVSLGKDELEEKKRGDLQDTLTVLAQNAEVLGPEAQERVREITDMLLESSVPESKRLGTAPAEQPMPEQMVDPNMQV